ncbi:MAG TPA: asparagine synthase (glutamine-hydrolyzing) [Steroidobacteraceae bacterium]|nr:asparagine synthase (glutamine-hydrolyzing) [Steroidobacteraceae bacterium]
MCGITGFISRGIVDPQHVCRRMTDAISHRGPDDAGVWVDSDVGIALGHRRLAILDVSPAGHQPMSSAGGRFQIAYNGEIYNHLEIRRELESKLGGVAWRSRSDTETLLVAIETWGANATLRKCVGMFAIAVWDRLRRRLLLARDRFGEKPLYYGRLGSHFVFGSELKALRLHPGFDETIDRDSVALFLRHCYIPEPRTIYQHVNKLPPATILEVDERGQAGSLEHYWHVTDAIDAARERPFAGGDGEAVDRLEGLLDTSIGLQTIADVPVGAFLSGGIDSSLVVALMQRQGAAKTRTFTIGFSEKAYDESSHARAVALHLGTEHTELVVTPAQAMEVIPQLPSLYDEPFGDSSQIPTYLVSKLAREHVTVSLSGDAGDELFGGYTRYGIARQLHAGLRRIPDPLLARIPNMIRSRSPEWWDRYLRLAAPILPRRWEGARLGNKMYRLAELMVKSPWELYHGLVSHWSQPDRVVIGCEGAESPVRELMSQPSALSYAEQMMYWDLLSYLPGDILVKVDRAAMAVGLETRVPMLDHRIVEFAWSLPLHLKVRAGQGKWILRQLLNRYVPRELTDRPKTGFGIPIGSWLRGPLRDWAEALLDQGRMRGEGVLEPALIRQRWLEHLSGNHDWGTLIWEVLMFQAWMEGKDERPAAVMAAVST